VKRKGLEAIAREFLVLLGVVNAEVEDADRAISAAREEKIKAEEEVAVGEVCNSNSLCEGFALTRVADDSDPSIY
jgi:hypothetical protein